MSVPENNEFILGYWNRSVSIGNGYIRVSLDGDRFSYQPCGKTERVDGWYVSYRWYFIYNEGVFVFFKDRSDRILIGWKRRVIDVSSIDKLRWSSDFWGRLLECFDQNGNSLLKARYDSFCRFLLNPLALLGELLIPDLDRWLLTDLPRDVCNMIRRGNIHKDFEELWEDDEDDSSGVSDSDLIDPYRILNEVILAKIINWVESLPGDMAKLRINNSSSFYDDDSYVCYEVEIFPANPRSASITIQLSSCKIGFTMGDFRTAANLTGSSVPKGDDNLMCAGTRPDGLIANAEILLICDAIRNARFSITGATVFGKLVGVYTTIDTTNDRSLTYSVGEPLRLMKFLSVFRIARLIPIPFQKW